MDKLERTKKCKQILMLGCVPRTAVSTCKAVTLTRNSDSLVFFVIVYLLPYEIEKMT